MNSGTFLHKGSCQYECQTKLSEKSLFFGICMSGFKRINVKAFPKDVLSCLGNVLSKISPKSSKN